MSAASPDIRDLARRLVALEGARHSPPVAGGSAAQVCEKLRVPLANLAGVAGFRALVSRALALAKAEVPSLAAVKVLPNGSIEGLDGIEQRQDAGAGVVVVAQLLGLLVTFIGESLTLHLVRDAWPDAFADGSGTGSREGR